MQDIYAIYRNADSVEGRGPMILTGAYETFELARAQIPTTDSWGRPNFPATERNGVWSFGETEIRRIGVMNEHDVWAHKEKQARIEHLRQELAVLEGK